DLTTEEGLKGFLSSTPFVASTVTSLRGGTANFTYRIVLQEPYVHNGSHIRTMIVKHAESYVATNKSFPLQVERQEYETLACRRIPEITSPSPIISLPTIFYEDRVNRVIIMSDAGINSLNLKDLLLKSPPSVEISHTLGRALGKFLAEMHVATHDAKNSLDAPGVILKGEFSRNPQARTISALVSYGWLVRTLSPTPGSQLEALVTPIIDAAQVQQINEISEVMRKRIIESNDVLSMGDLWSGNILVSSDAGVHVNIIDWELAKPGLAGLDIGHCFAELHQMRFFYPASKNSVTAIISSFTAAYRETVLESGSGLNLVEVARFAASRAGTHMVVLTPQIPSWKKGEEKQREMMKEGIEYITRAHGGDDKWLKESIVGGLFP
ncbi:kinase-like domain-containing protein, partial [Hysterangium stoloniferum]